MNIFFEDQRFESKKFVHIRIQTCMITISCGDQVFESPLVPFGEHCLLFPPNCKRLKEDLAKFIISRVRVIKGFVKSR